MNGQEPLPFETTAMALLHADFVAGRFPRSLRSDAASSGSQCEAVVARGHIECASARTTPSPLFARRDG